MAFGGELAALGGGEVTLVPQDERGHIDVAGVLADLPDDALVYCCGPEPLLKAVEAVAPEGRLRTERFAAPAVARDDGDDSAFEVECRASGVTLNVGPAPPSWRPPRTRASPSPPPAATASAAPARPASWPAPRPPRLPAQRRRTRHRRDDDDLRLALRLGPPRPEPLTTYGERRARDHWPYLDPHQTRDHEPTPYETKLARTLEDIFTKDGHELSDVIDGLNSRQLRTPTANPGPRSPSAPRCTAWEPDMTLSTRDSADHIYAHGLRNQWHPVVPSRFVEPGGMRRVTALGENWLLFRKSDGALSMLADRCPHRGAPLSLGKHLGDRVACWYHGVEVDGAGTVTSVPGLPGCNLEGKTLVTSLPVREVGGAILAYFGDEEHPEPVELTLPEPLADEEISAFLCYAEWGVPWRFAMENLLDPMHGAFLHSESHTMFAGDTSAKFRIRETERGYFFEKTDQRGVNFDWVELCHTVWTGWTCPSPTRRRRAPAAPSASSAWPARWTRAAPASSSGATAR